MNACNNEDCANIWTRPHLDTLYLLMQPIATIVYRSLGGYESRWKIEFGFEYFTRNHERRHLEEGISISFACTVYMD